MCPDSAYQGCADWVRDCRSWLAGTASYWGRGVGDNQKQGQLEGGAVRGWLAALPLIRVGNAHLKVGPAGGRGHRRLASQPHPQIKLVLWLKLPQSNQSFWLLLHSGHQLFIYIYIYRLVDMLKIILILK
uniref:Uncharacterized protein n=1 Tax=Pipistrellus kuhlii TaxID=59472 RepID=A0A7J7ZJW8_PIPKU|nr:hypothetical protein mPipKuh1_009607 [Pipistrellus kuhlii]